MKIPEYLPLLSSIKQLFNNEDNDHPDKHILLNWAKKLAILQLQLGAQSPSRTLFDSLIKDKANIIAIIVKLNALFDASNTQNKQDLQEFHQIVEHFYQQLNRLNHTYTEPQRQTLWHSPLSTHESTTTLSAQTHDKQDNMPKYTGNTGRVDTTKPNETHPNSLSDNDMQSTHAPSGNASITATENTSVLSKVGDASAYDGCAHDKSDHDKSAHNDPTHNDRRQIHTKRHSNDSSTQNSEVNQADPLSHKNESLFLKQLFDDEDV